MLNITCSHAVFQIVTHKIIFEKLFSDKCCILCTTTSRHNFDEQCKIKYVSVRLKVLIAEMLRMAAMHNVGPNMADFATFIRDCVISVTGKYDVTEKTQ